MAKLQVNSLTTEQDLERHKRWLEDLHIRYDELKKDLEKALILPTEEQIISELIKVEDLEGRDLIIYMPEDKSFTLFRQERADDVYEIDLVRFENGCIYIAKSYPPHLVELIGKFYGGD